MHLILTGATGLVGSACLDAMLRNQSVSKISVLSRRPVPQASSTDEAKQKCKVFIQKDFSSTPSQETLTQLQGAKGCVWAQGISVNDVSADEYRKITIDYPLLAARSFATLPSRDSNQPFNFVYVSGEGATTSPGMMTARFGKVKGEAEFQLLQLSKQEEYQRLRVFSARPAGVDSFEHQEVKDAQKERPVGMTAKLAKPLFPVFRALYKDMISPTKELGDALVALASGNGEALPEGPGISGEGRTLSNVALRRLAGL